MYLKRYGEEVSKGLQSGEELEEVFVITRGLRCVGTRTPPGQEPGTVWLNSIESGP